MTASRIDLWIQLIFYGASEPKNAGVSLVLSFAFAAEFRFFLVSFLYLSPFSSKTPPPSPHTQTQSENRNKKGGQEYE